MIPVVCIGVAAYIVLACGLGRGIGSVIKRADEAMDVPQLSEGDVDFINVIPADAILPPLVTAADYDADLPPWLFDLPTQPLTQDEFDLSEHILRNVA